MDEQHDTTHDLRTELRMRYNTERSYYMARTPEAKLQLDADVLHDIAITFRMSPERIGSLLGLGAEVIAKAQD